MSSFSLLLFVPSIRFTTRLLLQAGCAAGLLIGAAPATGSTPLTPEASSYPAQQTELASINSLQENGNGDSTVARISADGRFVCFRSYATDLIPNDGNIYADIYVRDTLLQTTERVSVDSFGAESDASSYEPVLSADGRYVAFRSFATNLVANDTNTAYDIFVHDRVTRQTERVSVRTNEVEGDAASSAPAISADGRFVAFHSVAKNLVPNDSNNQVDIFLRDRHRGATLRISVSSSGAQGNGRSHEPSMSATGRWVTFYSYASNLVPGDSNGVADIFVRDNLLQTTERVSVSSSGVQASADCLKPDISADGRWVTFHSTASNLVNGDNNGVSDVFVHDRVSGITERMSIDSSGSETNNTSVEGRLSADGRFVVFQSSASNLVPLDSNNSEDIFIRDRMFGTTERLNHSRFGDESDGFAYSPAISADGRRIAFWSSANDITDNDVNGNDDVFVRDRGTGSDRNVIILSGPWRRQTGQTVAMQWFAGPPSTQYALAVSLSNQGSYFAGHLFELGKPYQVLCVGEHSLTGTGSCFMPPLGPHLSGRTLYFEVAAVGTGSMVYDSILHAVAVQ